MRKPTKPRKHKVTDAELANDPSLRWHAYAKYEPLDSDTHGCTLAFSRYTDEGRIVLASMNGLSELRDAVCPLTVRRRSERRQELSADMKRDLIGGVIAATKRRLA